MAVNVIVSVRAGESANEALKRFNKKCEAEGILKEIRMHEFFVPISVRKRYKRKFKYSDSESI